MGRVRFGPAFLPSHESPDEAIRLLVEAGFDACEIDFEGGFWMDYDFAGALRRARARAAGVALSVHAPIAGFMGHAERGKKLNMAVGMLDHSAGIATAAGAELGRVPPRLPARPRRGRRRSTPSSSSSASCASGSRGRIAPCRSGSR